MTGVGAASTGAGWSPAVAWAAMTTTEASPTTADGGPVGPADGGPDGVGVPARGTSRVAAERAAHLAALPLEQVADGGKTRSAAGGRRRRRGLVTAGRDVWARRELLNQLTRKEIKVRYKDSALGFVWTLARPLLQLFVYWVAIGQFLGAGIANYAIFLFCGLIAWTTFTDALGSATGSIIGNAGLVKKVWFPREVLPLAGLGSALFHGVLQVVALVAVLLVTRQDFLDADLLVLPLAIITGVTLALALGFALAAANVFLRDTQHLLEVVLLLWFWMTPIVYKASDATNNLGEVSPVLAEIYLLNPMLPVVAGFQRAFYDDEGGDVLFGGDLVVRLLAVLAVSLVVLVLSHRSFVRSSGSFAQEL